MKMKRMCFFIMVMLIMVACGSSSQLFRDLPGTYGMESGLSEQDAAAGIREALIRGTNLGVDLVSVTDGYFGNREIKIPFPPEAREIESTLRNIGLDKKVDEVILSINRAAEMAADEARSIFISAITGMTVIDALDIVRGADNAATLYLQRTTSQQLQGAFRPIISRSLERVDATRYWDDVVNTYNMIPFVKKMDPDLAGYVTGKAIEGLFVMIAKEELAIRRDPMARTTELLKKVFGSN
ncbi:MAG: DUF4197 domain-containing protein [Bacteroidales bacterium]|nr:DUF4197 domain-containing protein [Bacteroidales bacterium]